MRGVAHDAFRFKGVLELLMLTSGEINPNDADGNVMQYCHLIPAGRLAKKPIDGNLHGSFISTIFHMNEHDDDLLVVFEPSGFALSDA